MPIATRRFVRTCRLALLWVLAACAWAWLPPAHALELTELDVTRNEEGVFVNYGLQMELSRPVEEALQRGVPIHFVAEATMFRRRWYWMDRRVGDVSRDWRLAFQPLTRRYRLTIGTLSQTFESLSAALAGVRRASQWKVADAIPPGTDDRYYVEFRFRLDTSQLPGPLQLGLEGQADWTMKVDQTVPVPEAPAR